MDSDTLLRRKVAIEQRFTELQKTRDEADDEMKRLQGEHRLVLDLLDSAPVAEEKPKRIRKAVEADATDQSE